MRRKGVSRPAGIGEFLILRRLTDQVGQTNTNDRVGAVWKVPLPGDFQRPIGPIEAVLDRALHHVGSTFLLTVM